MKLGFFQMNGGTETDPKYELSSPIFPKAVLFLPNGNKLQIKAHQVSTNHYYIQDLRFNGREVSELFLNHSDLMKGGILEYHLADLPKQK